MPEPAPVEILTSVIPLTHAGPDVFTNENPLWTTAEGARGIFGGFLIAHSINAAKNTVPASFDVHSLQSSFLRPGDGKDKLVYRVQRLTDGRSFANRLVRVTQGDDNANIFVATVGFQKNASIPDAAALRYQVPVPDLGGLRPEEVSDEAKQEVMSLIGVTPDWMSRHPADPFDLRPLPLERVDDPTQFRSVGFIRSTHPFSTDDRSAHLGALGFMSDEWLLGSVTLANPDELAQSLSRRDGGGVSIQASMNHTTLFHSPDVRVDQWMVYERKTSWAAQGRVLVEQRIWNLGDGKLVKSTFQEGLVRLRSSSL